MNTVMQVTSNPQQVAVGISKQNYTCDLVLKTGKLNVNCLTVDTPFEVFRHFGFQSGRNTDKFSGETHKRSESGLIVLPEHISAYLSLNVENSLDLGTHVLFLCSVVESQVLSKAENMTYAYYQKNVKPNPRKKRRKRRALCARFAGMYMRVTPCRRILSVLYASTELRILKKYPIERRKS